jgi:hypothetical protein
LFRKDTRTFHEKLEKAKAKHIDNVQKYLKELQSSNGDLPNSYRLSDRLFKGSDMPTKPSAPRLERVEALVQQLELSDDEIVTCDTKEEYVQLTRACAILGTCKI